MGPFIKSITSSFSTTTTPVCWSAVYPSCTFWYLFPEKKINGDIHNPIEKTGVSDDIFLNQSFYLAIFFEDFIDYPPRTFCQFGFVVRGFLRLQGVFCQEHEPLYFLC
jgi:hypothetical protein